jgi:ribonuclease R/exosome complex exonuclease DIS3/RRP44
MGKKKKQQTELERKITKAFLKNPNKELNYKQVSAALNVTDTKKRNEIIKAISKMVNKKKLLIQGKGKHILAKKENNKVEGVLEITSTGKGYVVSDQIEEDVLIEQRRLNKAFNGDRVEVLVSQRRIRGKLEGEVVGIVKRKKEKFIGVFERKEDYGFVNTRNARMYTDFFIKKEDMGGYKSGETVVVEIKKWEEKKESPEGRIVKSLGEKKEEIEAYSILYEHGLSVEFPEKVEKEAEKKSKENHEKEIKKRKDMREALTFTIDPDDAKDFDDAISFVEKEENIFEIGVHIADVSHFVAEGTELDKEAKSRATSVYLVDRVVPMLPEILSNNLCSLRPNEDKLTFSAIFQINKNGEVKKEWFGKTVIRSNERLSYQEAKFLIDSESLKIPKEVSLNNKERGVERGLTKALLETNEIAKKIRKKRIGQGAIIFDKTEVKFELDENKHPKKIKFKKAENANKLIEELMLLANKRVAEKVKKFEKKPKFIYRVHDKPDQEKLKNLKRTVEKFGHTLSLTKGSIAKELNALLLEVNGKKEKNLIDTLMIRSMSKAEYTTKNIGHYGLAFSDYTHFTSPIRRYPDVLVHRVLEASLNQTKIKNEDELEELAEHSTEKEIHATKAERDSIKLNQVKYMQDKTGKRYEAVISGVIQRGVFVEVVDNKCEGLVKAKDLPGDFYVYDLKNHMFQGERTGKKYQLGDEVAVVLQGADLVKKQLDFQVVS